jgi:arylsulfatase
MRFTTMSALKRHQSEFALAGILLTMGIMPAAAHQPECPIGSPCATAPISGKQLPPPPDKFEGKIEKNAGQSKPWWPPRVVPPKGAPNILLIMTDDSGFGVPSTFGGVIPTPTLDRIAAMDRVPA